MLYLAINFRTEAPLRLLAAQQRAPELHRQRVADEDDSGNILLREALFSR